MGQVFAWSGPGLCLEWPSLVLRYAQEELPRHLVMASWTCFFNKKTRPEAGHKKNPGSDLLSQQLASTIGARGLTAVFGMGTGVSLQLWPPGKIIVKRDSRKEKL